MEQRLTGHQVKPPTAAWRPLDGNPGTHEFRGQVCLRPCPRHHLVVDGRPLLRSSLTCAQTAPGARHLEIMIRL
jgi:hypothetical protein